MKSLFRNLLVCCAGMGMLGVGVSMVQKLAAQSPGSAQTRIYIPWFGGSDAGYTSLLQINNTSMDPYGTTATSGTCTVDAYANGSHFGPGILSYSQGGTTTTTIPPGVLQVYTEADVAAAAKGLSLSNSGQRGYLMLTCNFKYAHAQGLLVMPGGSIAFMPGLIIPPNRSLSTGPEQLLQ